MTPLNPDAAAWAPPWASMARLGISRGGAPAPDTRAATAAAPQAGPPTPAAAAGVAAVPRPRAPSPLPNGISLSELATAGLTSTLEGPSTPSSIGGEDFTFDDVFEQRARSVASASTGSPKSLTPLSPGSFSTHEQQRTLGRPGGERPRTEPSSPPPLGAAPARVATPSPPGRTGSWVPGSPTVTSVAPTRAAHEAAAELMADEAPGSLVTGTDGIIAEAEAVEAAELDPSLSADAVTAAGAAARAAASASASFVTVHVPTAAAEAAARVAAGLAAAGAPGGLAAALDAPPSPAAAPGARPPDTGPLPRPTAPIGPADFELLRVVGQGAFGKVFQVRKRDTREVFAMKVMRKDRIHAKDHHEYVRAERDVLTAIVHPYIVTLRFSFQTSRKLYLVLDFVNGGHLFFQLYRAGTFDEARARLYTAEIVLAVAHLHERGFVHRDLKPENVLVGADGHVKVTDFGLAKVGAADDASARSNSFIGTLEYMAPEIVASKGHGKAVDWWSVGVLLYEMLCGVPPFRAKGKNALQKAIVSAKPKLPPYLSAQAASCLRSLLQKDPAKRLGFGPSGSREVMSHPFFKQIDWERLEAYQIPAPVRPVVTGPESVENFDKIWTDLPPSDSPVGTPRDDDPLKEADRLFEGFTYIAPATILTRAEPHTDAGRP